MATSCAQGVAASEAAAVGPATITLVLEDRSPFPEKEFDFVERPSQDFFCPVSLELLLEPQQMSCCGNHLSLEVATRLRKEGKSCPVCNGEQWSAMLDKYHRRRVHEVRVRCWNKDSGCGWVGGGGEQVEATRSLVREAAVGVRVLRTQVYLWGGRGEPLA